jgi:UDP-glucose 4-epimerase
MGYILVSGGAGYVGSAAALALQDAGYSVVVLDNFVKGHRDMVFGELAEGDLRDEAFLKELFTRYSVEGVLHFAAFSLVGESMKEPEKYYANNVEGTLSLLRAMRAAGVSRFVLSSTAAVYGEPERIPIQETDPLVPTNVYGETKLFLEQVCRRYGEAYGLSSVMLRYFNAAGADPRGRAGEDHAPETHLIPLVLDTVLGRRKNITLFGSDYPTPDGTCIRDYVHVADLASAHLGALESLFRGEGEGRCRKYNLGNGKGYSVAEVIAAVEKVTGASVPVERGERRWGDPAVLVASSEKAERELGWCREYSSLENMVETAWEWHKRRFA